MKSNQNTSMEPTGDENGNRGKPIATDDRAYKG